MGLAVIVRYFGDGDGSYGDNASNIIHFANPSDRTLTNEQRIGQFETAYQNIKDNIRSTLHHIFKSSIFQIVPEQGFSVGDMLVLKSGKFAELMEQLLINKKGDLMGTVRALHNENPAFCDAIFCGGFAAIIRSMAEKNQDTLRTRKPVDLTVFKYDAFLCEKCTSPLIMTNDNIALARNFTSNVIHSLDLRLASKSPWPRVSPIFRVELLRYVFNIFLLPYVPVAVMQKFTAGPIAISEEDMQGKFIKNIPLDSRGISNTLQNSIRVDNEETRRLKQIEVDEADRQCVEASRKAGEQRLKGLAPAERLRQEDALRKDYERRAVAERRKRDLEEISSLSIPRRTNQPASGGGGREGKRPKPGLTSQFPLFSPTLTPSLKILSDAFDSVRLC